MFIFGQHLTNLVASLTNLFLDWAQTLLFDLLNLLIFLIWLMWVPRVVIKMYFIQWHTWRSFDIHHFITFTTADVVLLLRYLRFRDQSFLRKYWDQDLVNFVLYFRAGFHLLMFLLAAT